MYFNIFLPIQTYAYKYTGISACMHGYILTLTNLSGSQSLCLLHDEHIWKPIATALSWESGSVSTTA